MLQLGITGTCVVEYVSRIIQIANEVAQQNLPRIVFHSAVFEFKLFLCSQYLSLKVVLMLPYFVVYLLFKLSLYSFSNK